MKTSLHTFRTFKNNVDEEEIYDNMPLSTTLNKTTTNTLQLNYRNKHTHKECNCIVSDKEDIYNCMLHCTS